MKLYMLNKLNLKYIHVQIADILNYEMNICVSEYLHMQKILLLNKDK